MPTKPKTACTFSGCPALTPAGTRYCPAHQKQTSKQEDANRGTATQRGYGGNWRKVRAVQLARHPECEDCLGKGRHRVAELVHHRDGDSRNNTAENLASLCRPCHEELHREQGERWGGKRP